MKTSYKGHDLTSIIVQIPKSASFMFFWAPSSKIFEPKITNIFNQHLSNDHTRGHAGAFRKPLKKLRVTLARSHLESNIYPFTTNVFYVLPMILL